MRGVYGSHFRRVPVTDPARFGLLGHASVLAVTSYPNRTSPVVRGKWILENLLGTPPPPPPPGVPTCSRTTRPASWIPCGRAWRRTARARSARRATG